MSDSTLLLPDVDQQEAEVFDPRMWDAICGLIRDPYLVRDTTGRVVRWNQAMLDLFELTEREFRDRDPRDPRVGMVRPDGTELPYDLNPAMLVLQSGGSVNDMALGIRGRDDTIRWVSVDSTPLTGSDGSVVAVVTVVRPRQQDAEQTSTASQWRTHEAFERSAVAMLVIDENGRVVDHNQSATKLLRIPSHDLQGMDWVQFTGLRISDRLAQLLRPPIMQDMAPDILEYGGVDGCVVPGLTSMSAIAVPGVEQATLVQILDVSELVDARRTAEALGQQLNAVFDGSPIGMGLVDADGSVVRSNAPFNRLLELAAEEEDLPGTFALVHPEDRQMVRRFIDRAFAGRHLTFDHRVQTSDGEIKWHRSQLSSVGTPEHPLLLLQSVDHTAERESEFMRRSIDRMTGMKSSEGIVDDLGQAVENARETNGCFALLCVNIEGYRSINDRIGLRAADQLLQRLAISVQASLPYDSSVGRVRGAVFLAIVPVDDVREARRLADSIERSIGDEIIPGSNEPVRCAIGAMMVSSTNSSSADLIADIEQLTALAATVPERRMIETHSASADAGQSGVPAHDGSDAIGDAILAENVVAVGEPLFDLREAPPLRHFELFVRLVLSNGEHVPFPRFEQHARRLGKMARIDELMIRRGIALLEANPDLALEVNVAPESMVDSGVLGVIRRLVRERPVNPARLLLAVDQSVLMQSTHTAHEFVEAVHEGGCGLVIDDFGTIPGGERLLSTFEPARVKLDPGLIYPADGRMNEAYLRNLVAAATELGIETVAPFATSDAGVQLAAEHGLTLVQGRAVGHPINFG